MRWYGWLGLVMAGVGVAAYIGLQKLNEPLMATGEEAIAALRAEVAAQNEAAFIRPTPSPAIIQPSNPIKNVYFGDLHIHTSLSFDSYLFGNRIEPDEAYRIAKGEVGEIKTGEQIRLTRPLDFAALTDHAEGFGLHEACASDEQTDEGLALCAQFEAPSITTFLQLREQGEKRPPVRDLSIYNNNPETAIQFSRSTWDKIRQVAESHNEPGVFTTFAAYEYSPPLPDSGKHHRNIIFRGDQTASDAVSAFDAASEIDLWKALEAGCKLPCQFLTIPHNPNKTWGLAFANHTIDGIPYTEQDWALRERNEPIVEMFQIKGNSECSSTFGAADEECDFEQFFPPCAEGQDTLCIKPTAMIRDGLHIGLALEDQIGINPLKFGLIGSTDTHNANPGDTEEWDFRGASGLNSSPARRRLSPPRGGRVSLQRNPGGLAAIWAEENTRDALFDSMQRKEVYATSGTRIRLRVFAGFNIPQQVVTEGDVALAYQNAVPMGSTIDAQQEGLDIFVLALRDPDSAPLQKIQIIKGWIEGGQRQEKVFDVACSGGVGVNPDSGKCEPNGATVDLTDCSWSEEIGAAELKSLWRDPKPAVGPPTTVFAWDKHHLNPFRQQSQRWPGLLLFG
jgi:hypothetical protein